MNVQQMTAQQIVQQYLESLSTGDMQRVASYLPEDFVYRPEEGVQVPKAMYLSAVRSIHDAMPDIAYTIDNWRVDGNQVAVKVGGNGTHTGVFAFPVPGFPVVQPTGAYIHLAASDWVFTVQDNQIVELVLHLTPGGSAIDILKQMGAPLPQ